MKKIVCLILALALLAVCTACSGSKNNTEVENVEDNSEEEAYSQYGDSAVLEIGSATAKPGSTVELDISVHNNPGTSTIGLELEFDSSVLTPVSIERTGALAGVGFFTSNLDGKNEYGAFNGDEGAAVQGIWFNTGDFTENGPVMTVTFKVAKNAPAGEYAVKAVPHEDDFTNEKLEYVKVAYLDGAVTVS